MGADRAADPVALHELDGFGPVDLVETREEPLGIGRDAQHPLLEGPAEHGMIAAVGPSICRDFLVREHGAERRTPVHRRLAQVREPLRVDQTPPAELAELRPAGRTGGRAATPRLVLGDEL